MNKENAFGNNQPKDEEKKDEEKNQSVENPHQQEHLVDIQDVLREADEDDQNDARVSTDHIQIDHLKTQLAEEKDNTVRALAEIENIKRRAQKDLENAHKFAVESLVKELISVLDSFDGAKQAIPTEHQQSLQGIVMIENNFMQVLGNHGIKAIEPNKGDEFEPEQHQATSIQQHDDYAPNQIIALLQRGFSVKGRLIRPAMVIVSA